MITLNDQNKSILRRMKIGWKMEAVEDKHLVKMIGETLTSWYE